MLTKWNESLLNLIENYHFPTICREEFQSGWGSCVCETKIDLKKDGKF